MKKLIVLLILSSFFLVSCGETQDNNSGEDTGTGVENTELGTDVDYKSDTSDPISCGENEDCGDSY